MATFDISHPDVLDLIRAKREPGRLRQFNLSLLITEEFMQAVAADDEWRLVFPINKSELQETEFNLEDTENVVWHDWPGKQDYIVNEHGKVACRVHKVLPARRIWDAIMSSTYDFAEPGFILIDRVNELNNNWFCENIRATNPCGEQPLPEYGACLLGSINLTRFVLDPFTDSARFDWDKFREVVRIFTRMLDNVVDINGLPLANQVNEILRKRRHGMGFLGLGSTLALLKIKYGEAESLEFTETVSRELALTGWRVALELAREKGPAPIMDEMFTVTTDMLRQRPEMATDGFKQGDQVKGSILHSRYSRYMQKIRQLDPDLVADLETGGARFTHHSSIAPTGTIALSLANNASNGIEPSFAQHYARNIIRPGKKSKQKVDVYSYELLAYRHLINPEAMQDAEKAEQQLPDYFISSDDISPRQHVDIQAAAQQWIDSSISKTANVPTDYPYEDFKDIYRYAHAQGLKGCTTFRFNPEAFQGVLVKEKDLENTCYRFVLEDGEVIEVKGNEEIEYDGEIHTAANLYDALKEGYYGKL
jgi:ribonucleoside-diphosphate reductase alpha chain